MILRSASHWFWSSTAAAIEAPDDSHALAAKAAEEGVVDLLLSSRPVPVLRSPSPRPNREDRRPPWPRQKVKDAGLKARRSFPTARRRYLRSPIHGFRWD